MIRAKTLLVNFEYVDETILYIDKKMCNILSTAKLIDSDKALIG